jgi:hypothetical protein
MTWSNPKSLPINLKELKEKVLLGTTDKSLLSKEVQWLMCDKLTTRNATSLKEYSSGAQKYPAAWGQCGTKSTSKVGYCYFETTDGKGRFRHYPNDTESIGSGMKWQIQSTSAAGDNAPGAMYVNSQFYADTDCGTLSLRYRINSVSGNTNGGTGGVIEWRVYVYAFDNGFGSGAADLIADRSGTSSTNNADRAVSFTVPAGKRYLQVSAVAWMSGTDGPGGSGNSLVQESKWAFYNMQVRHI